METEGWKGERQKCCCDTEVWKKIYGFNHLIVMLLKVVFFNHYSSVSLLIGDSGRSQDQLSSVTIPRHMTKMEKSENRALGCFFFFVLAPRAFSSSPF